LMGFLAKAEYIPSVSTPDCTCKAVVLGGQSYVSPDKSIELSVNATPNSDGECNATGPPTSNCISCSSKKYCKFKTEIGLTIPPFTIVTENDLVITCQGLSIHSTFLHYAGPIPIPPQRRVKLYSLHCGGLVTHTISAGGGSAFAQFECKDCKIRRPDTPRP
jgi:hypothetical protein